MTCGKPGSARAPDGTEIAWFRSGEGPPLVLIHGTTSDHTRWEPVMAPLTARATVYAVDRRGRGSSGDAPAYRTQTEFDDVAAVVDAIGEPVTLLGHSFGGLCALEGALRTDGVGRLILYEPAFHTEHALEIGATMDRVNALVEAGDREAALTTFMLEVVGVSPEVLEQIRSSPSWEGRVAAAHTITREDTIERTYRFDPSPFSDLSVPTLLLTGSESPPMLTEPSRILERTLPNARTAVMEGQAHIAMTTGPDLFVREVLRFLDEA